MTKRNIERITAVILIFSLFVSTMASVFSYKETDDYYNTVIENFEKTFEESEYFERLCSDEYRYEIFSDNMQDVNWAGKAVVWCTYSLLDKKLNKDAYVTYLTQLLAMMNTSLAETAYNQAQYNQTLNVDDAMTSLALNLLFTNEDAKNMFENSIELMDGVIKIDEEIEKGTEKMNAVSFAISNFEIQYFILETIKQNTDDKKLASACDEVKQMCAYQCAYISDQCIKENIKLVGNASQTVWSIYGDAFAAKINSGFVTWVRNKLGAEAGEAFLRKLALLGKVSLFATGMKIGGDIMKLFVSDKVEMFREQTALAEISDALTTGLVDTKNAAMSGSAEERYTNIQNYVNLANALIYTHVRGEYCSVQTLDEETRDSVYKNYYENSLCPRMEEYRQTVTSILTTPILDKTIQALDTVQSVHISQNSIADYTVMGTRVNMNMTLDSDINISQGITYVNMTANQGGRNVSSEIYIQGDTSTTDIYMSSNGIWLKQTGVPTADLYKLGSGFDGLEGIRFYLTNMEEIYLDSSSDPNNHIVSGIIGSDATEEVLRKGGLTTIIDQLDSNDEISDSDIESLLNNLDPIKITVLIDKDTFLPTQMTMDMKDTTDSMYRNIENIASKYGESISYSITTNKGVTNFSRYNDLSEIFIPDEATNGREYTIIN